MNVDFNLLRYRGSGEWRQGRPAQRANWGETSSFTLYLKIQYCLSGLFTVASDERAAGIHFCWKVCPQ